MLLPRFQKAALLPLAFAAGCSSSGNSGAGDVMYIESCSLGCNNGEAGDQIFCTLINTYQNQEVSVVFSESVDMSTVTPTTFRVVKVSNGTSPLGTYLQDPNNPRRVIFRPDLSFDELGNPLFGFEPDTAYAINIPGANQGDAPPFIRAANGKLNSTRLQCTILTDQGIVDLVPGAPQLELSVDVVTAYDADENPIEFEFDVPADGATNVFRFSDIRFKFLDIMNPATLVNPSTGQAPFIRVAIDSDGQLGTEDDRLTVVGEFEVSLELSLLTTNLVFTPLDGYPSAGDPDEVLLSPRRVVITIPPTVVDLAGNSITTESGGGTRSFVPERLRFEPIEFIEDFRNTDREDSARSAAAWGDGKLESTTGGGSGRLGVLVVRSGQTLELDTDDQFFPLPDAGIDVMGNPAIGPGTKASWTDFPISETITDGTFEFGRILVESGGSLKLSGASHARLLSRGRLIVQAGGTIDVSGTSPPAHAGSVPKPREAGVCSDTTILGQDDCEAAGGVWTFLERGTGGPNGGDGGFGGDRYDVHCWDLGTCDLVTIGAIDNPGAEIDGQPGQGVGRSVNPDLGEGDGGISFPANFPTTLDAVKDRADMQYGPVGVAATPCIVRQVGGAGAGGAYASDGTAGTHASPSADSFCPAGGVLAPPDPTEPGFSSEFGLTAEPPDLENDGYAIRLLDPHDGFLRGGAGGGGGGMHPYGVVNTNFCEPPFITCDDILSFFSEWHDHSGASGGGAGGALQLVSGHEVVLLGRVDASGGNGAGPATLGVPEVDQRAMPGGGGSGGAVRIESEVVTLGSSGDHVDVRGGLGGPGVWSPSAGGDGGYGLVRIIDNSERTYLEMNQAVAPAIQPFIGGATSGDPDSLELLSVEPTWSSRPERPESLNGSVSCWIRPSGNFFGLQFDEDDETDTSPEAQGWNMDVFWQGTTTADLIPFRGDNDEFDNSFETEFGNTINSAPDAGMAQSPVAVRFQGARVVGEEADLCDTDPASVFLTPGSVTPWVDHPALLNDFPIQPNMIRFAIVFDHGVATAGDVRGVTNLRIGIQPN